MEAAHATTVGQIKSYKGNEMVGRGEGRHASKLSVVRTLLRAVTPWNRIITNISTNINATINVRYQICHF